MEQYKNSIENRSGSPTVAKEDAEYVEIEEMASRMEEGSENNEILSADISDAQSGGFQTIKSMVRATVIRPCFPMIASSEKTTYAAEKHESGLPYKDRVDNTKRVRIISAVRRSPE